MPQNDIQRPKGLPAKKLRATLPAEKVPYGDSREIPDKNGYSAFQPRARQALDMALRVRGLEYNVYVSGEMNLGRTYFVRNILEPAAQKAATPPDWVYLHNFDDPDRPLAVDLPAGMGKKLRSGMSKALGRIRSRLTARFEQEQFQKKRDSLFKRFNKARDTLLDEMENKASSHGFAMDYSESGSMVLSPLDKEGRPLGEEAVEALPAKRRAQLKDEANELLTEINDFMRKLNKSESDLKKKEEGLYRDAAQAEIAKCLEELRKDFADHERVMAHFKAVEEELLDNLDAFQPKDTSKDNQSPMEHSPEDNFSRCEINLFVDNSEAKGAPVILEDHPTTFNLLGSIEREAELGALYTDFSLIKAGSMHKANGGFLIINVEDLLTSPSSWEGMLRALRTGKSRIEDPVDPDQVRAKTIEPEPIPLNLKVVLTGTEELYETLLFQDDRFSKIFKLKAHLQDTAQRNMPTVRRYLQAMGRIIRETELPVFTREALAALVDHASRICEDQTKLSLEFPLVRECMIEAAAMADADNRSVVDGPDIAAALEARSFRSNLYEEEFLADYDREIIKVATHGSGVGTCNGLSVSQYGDYEFGLPHQISCTVGVGHGGILDLEREAQMGGPIHTKGMMIIKSYLVRLFAQEKPIVLTGSLCFEQSYAGIEGDSASGAELAALLSALSGVPIDLSLAFTGAISQSGSVMAVGGVNKKIEGFFEVCRRRGLTGRQGVLLPYDNVDNLMLRQDVLRAVEDGTFHIYPVKTIEEAMRILTGMRSGSLSAKGAYPSGTLYRLVDERLGRLAEQATRFCGGKEE